MARDQFVTSRLDYDERIRMEAAAGAAGVSRSQNVRRAALQAAEEDLRQARERDESEG